MRGKRARQLRQAAHEVTMLGGVKRGMDFNAIKRRLYRRMKRDWRRNERGGFDGLL
jgi:hypothetical protein